MATFEDIKLDAIDENVEDLEYITQIGQAILATPVGSIPFVPTFGADIVTQLDAPINAATKALMMSSAYAALDGFIPDTEVTSVNVTQGSGNRIKVTTSILYKGKVLEV